MKKIAVLILACFAFSIALTNTPDSITISNAPITESTSIYQAIISWYNEHLNYATIALLMAIESSFIPFPSELVVPPAAYKAFLPESDLNIVFILLSATCGALAGAFVNYYLAKFLGRPVIYKFADSKIGHMCLLDSKKVKRAEDFFLAHGAISTLVGRLIPAIRQLISIPAGLSKMKISSFALFTAIGAMFWNGVLILLGYIAHGNKDLIEKYNSELSMALIGLFVLFLIYIAAQAFKKGK